MSAIKQLRQQAAEHMAAGRFPEALAAYGEVLARAPQDAEAHLHHGRALQSLGRGDEATWKFPDDTMSKEHAALEVTGDRIRLRDLGSMNGIKLNGAETKVADLKNGDRFQLGKLVFQLVIEERRREPRTYVLED